MMAGAKKTDKWVEEFLMQQRYAALASDKLAPGERALHMSQDDFMKRFPSYTETGKIFQRLEHEFQVRLDVIDIIGVGMLKKPKI